MAFSSSIYNRTLLAVVLSLVILCSASVFALTIQNGLTQQDKTTIQSLLEKDFKGLTNKKDLFYSASTLLKISTGDIIQSAQHHCVKSLSANQIEGPEALYNLIASNTALKCAPLSTESYGAIQSALAKYIAESSDNTSAENIYSIARAILLTKSKINIADLKISNLYQLVVKQLSSSIKQDCNDACLKSVGFLLESAQILQSIQKTDVDSLNKAISSLATVTKKVISSNNVETIAIFARGLNKLATVVDLKSKVSKEDFAALISSLVNKKESKTLSEIYHLIEGVQSFTKPVHEPIIVVSELKDEKGAISVQISNILGASLNEKVTLQSVYKGSNSDDSILPKGPVKLESSNGVDFQIKGIKLDSGIFNFDITVGKTSVTRSFKTVAADLKIRDFQIDIAKFSRSNIAYPKSLDEKLTIDVDNNNRIRVNFALAGVTPHQVFLRIGNCKNEAIFNIKQQHQPNYNLDLGLDRVVGPALKYESGEYKVQIFIGDATLSTPIHWTVATVVINFSKQIEKTEEEVLYQPRELITHIFRVPEKRAGAEVASMFSLVILAPFAIFLIGLLTVGFNFKGCPGGISGLLAPVFVGLLAVLIAILTMYFISWDIFETMKYLGLVGIAITLIGSKVLSGVAEKRNAQN